MSPFWSALPPLSPNLWSIDSKTPGFNIQISNPFLQHRGTYILLQLTPPPISSSLVIDLLDIIEESRPLHPVELSLRSAVTACLHRTIKEKFAHWKQRGKIRAAIDGDENTKFFHVSASQRMRKNQIKILELNGQEFENHEQKASIFFDFYKQLLGTADNTSWSFSFIHYIQLKLQALTPLQTISLLKKFIGLFSV